MCGPFAIPLALVAAGAGAQYFGEKKAEKARERTFMAERKRQNAITDEQIAAFRDSLARTEEAATPEAMQRAKDARESSLVAAIQPRESEASYLPGAASAPAIVATANDKAQASAGERSSSLASAIAALGGTGDQMQQLNIDIARNADAIGQGNSFKRGSLDVLNDEMRAAANKGRTLRTVGGLAQAVGQAWLTGGMGGGFGGGGMPANLLKGTPYV
jgi:hypothetical protein